jgi:hypothetical protein
MQKRITQSIEHLEKWLNINGFAGYDPYDLKSMKFILWITRMGYKNKPFEIIREVIFETFYHYPLLFRNIFRIKKSFNAKAMGLFANSYLDLYKIFDDNNFKEKSLECLQWLKQNRSKDFPGLCWGYPFDWQSTTLIPANTPNGIVTTAAGEAFWQWYRFTGDNSFLDDCSHICEFLSALPYDKINDQQLCFSYTPLFQNHVHNLNLFVAEFLLKVGSVVKNDHWINLSQKAVNYTLANQLKDGSFDYNGPPEKPQNFVDNYHTGFVLRMLYSIWNYTKDKSTYTKLESAYNHYLTHFFKDNCIPKFKPDQLYRIDIHSCAESINCLSSLAVTFPEGLKTAQNVALWTIENLQHPDGYFYYGILRSRFTKRPFTSKIAYIRWGQAWMLKALTKLASIMN